MPKVVEQSGGVRQAPAPLQEMANLEMTRRMSRVTDQVSINTIMKSNTRVAKMLNRCFVAVGTLAKKSFGGVGKIGAVFKGLAKIAGGI